MEANAGATHSKGRVYFLGKDRVGTQLRARGITSNNYCNMFTSVALIWPISARNLSRAVNKAI